MLPDHTPDSTQDQSTPFSPNSRSRVAPLSTSYTNSTILGEDPERRMVRDRALHPNENSFGFFGRMAGGNLVPQPGIRPMTPAVEIRSINHWTVSEIPENCFLIPEGLFSVQVRLFKLHQRFGWGERRRLLAWGQQGTRPGQLLTGCQHRPPGQTCLSARGSPSAQAPANAPRWVLPLSPSAQSCCYLSTRRRSTAAPTSGF